MTHDSRWILSLTRRSLSFAGGGVQRRVGDRREERRRAGAKKPLTIAVIPKGTTHEFWKSIHAGAIQATQELAQRATP